MAHEVGHQALVATRFTLVTVWLAAPWRVATRVVVGVGRGLSGRLPRRLLAALVVTTVVLAVVQSVQRDQPVVAAVLVTLALCGMVCPLADAALSRRDELAADRYAAHAGYGSALAGALRRIGDGQHHRQRPLHERALARHPSMELRLDELHATQLAMAGRAVSGNALSRSEPHDTSRIAGAFPRRRGCGDPRRPGATTPAVKCKAFN